MSSAAALQANLSAIAQDLDPGFLEHLLETIVETIPTAAVSEAARATVRNAARFALLALHPADPFQAMLAAQAVATHYAIMDAFRRASDPQLAPAMATRLRANAAALSRTMQATLRTLRKLQNLPSEPAEPRTRRAPVPETPAAPQQLPVQFTPARPVPRSQNMTRAERRAWRRCKNPEIDRSSEASGAVLQSASAAT